MLPIRFETRHFPGGYHRPESDETDEDFDPDPRLFADERGATPKIIDGVDLENPAFIHLINCRSDGALLNFIDRFGDGSSTRLSDLHKKADLYRRLAVQHFDATRDPLKSDKRAGLLNNVLMHTKIVGLMRDIDGASRFVLSVHELDGFLALELAAAWEADARMASCLNCSRYFLIGPLTNRRKDAKYCSDRCRVAAMRARNSAQRVQP